MTWKTRKITEIEIIISCYIKLLLLKCFCLWLFWVKFTWLRATFFCAPFAFVRMKMAFFAHEHSDARTRHTQSEFISIVSDMKYNWSVFRSKSDTLATWEKTKRTRAHGDTTFSISCWHFVGYFLWLCSEVNRNSDGFPFYPEWLFTVKQHFQKSFYMTWNVGVAIK